MASRNEVFIEGNLTREPQVFNTANGKKIVKNSLAWNDSYKKGNDWVKVSHFFDLTAFGSSGETLEQFKKGDAVFVTGKLNMDSWDDKETGKKRSKVSIVAWKIEPIATREKPAEKPKGTPSVPVTNPVDGFEDEIPFN